MAYEVPESDLPPVTDWLHDWDWLDDQWGANAIDIWNEVRAVCPVATTERYGRAFMPVTYEAVAQVATRLAGELAESPPGLFVLRKAAATPEGFPRRVGVARKRPLA